MLTCYLSSLNTFRLHFLTWNDCVSYQIKRNVALLMEVGKEIFFMRAIKLPIGRERRWEHNWHCFCSLFDGLVVLAHWFCVCMLLSFLFKLQFWGNTVRIILLWSLERCLNVYGCCIVNWELDPGCVRSLIFSARTDKYYSKNVTYKYFCNWCR